jgi:hypothetical protein
MIERVQMSFKVKQFLGGQSWICLEPVEENLRVLGNGFLGFHLPSGTTIKQATKIAKFLEENIRSISYMTLPSD